MSVGLRIELRRSPARLILLALPIHLWFARTVAGPGVWTWDDTAAGVAGSVFLLGPIGGGLGAWVATRERRWRTGHLRQQGARHPAVGPVTELVAAIIWSLVEYAAAAVGLLLITAVRATYGSPSWWWLLAGAAGLALFTTVGWTAGRVLPHPWTAPVVAIATYLYATWNTSGQYGNWWFGLSPGNTQETTLFRVLNVRMFQAQTAWFVGLILAITLLWTLAAVRPRTRLLAVGLAVALTVATSSGVAVAAQRGRYYSGNSTFTYRCVGNDPQVCVHPAFAAGRTELLAAFRDLHVKVAGTPADFTRVEQRPRGVNYRPSAGSGRYSIDDLGSGFAKGAVNEYLDSVLGSGDQCFRPANETSEQRIGLLSVIRAWMVNDASVVFLVDDQVGQALKAFSHLSDPQRHAWFVKHYQRVVTCQLSESDFAS